MTEIRLEFGVDGAVKIVVDGEIPIEIHDATEAALAELVSRLGGRVTTKPLAAVHGEHSHRHGHVHHGRKR